MEAVHAVKAVRIMAVALEGGEEFQRPVPDRAAEVPLRQLFHHLSAQEHGAEGEAARLIHQFRRTQIAVPAVRAHEIPVHEFAAVVLHRRRVHRHRAVRMGLQVTHLPLQFIRIAPVIVTVHQGDILAARPRKVKDSRDVLPPPAVLILLL